MNLEYPDTLDEEHRSTCTAAYSLAVAEARRWQPPVATASSSSLLKECRKRRQARRSAYALVLAVGCGLGWGWSVLGVDTGREPTIRAETLVESSATKAAVTVSPRLRKPPASMSPAHSVQGEDCDVPPSKPSGGDPYQSFGGRK